MLLAYLLAGVTAYWESRHCLPTDSFRMTIVMALLCEAVLWHSHAMAKSNSVDAALHNCLALIALSTAAMVTISVIVPVLGGRVSLFVYVAGFVGFVWQGLWFFVAAVHQWYPVADTGEQVAVGWCISALFVVGLFQLALIVLRYRYTASQNSGEKERERNPLSFLIHDGFHLFEIKLHRPSTL